MLMSIPSPVIMTMAMGFLVVGFGLASLIYFHYEDKNEFNTTNNI
mgnify:CR=1 FL=1